MRRALTLLFLLGACRPASGPPLSLLTAPRLLALRGTPAEAAPGAGVSFDALVGGPDGEVAAPSLDWSLCPSPRPLTTNDVVAPSCLSDTVAATHAPSFSATLSTMACQLFGPDPAPAQNGQPPARPVAADATGGWYAPYRADFDGALNIGLERIRCNLAGASVDVAAEFAMQYQANQNPQPNDLTIGGALADGASLAPGQLITLEVGWPDGDAESYPVFDVASQTLSTQREAMRVSWYATGGAFADERTGRAGDDLTDDSDNVFTAPTTLGTVDLWAVLRDDRGGVGWSHARINITAP